MATLEERIQNLTQQVNPMGSGVMSDQDVERLMTQPQAFISTPKGQSTKLRMEAMLSLPKGSLSDSDALRMLQMMGGELNTQALPSVYETLKRLVGDLRNQTVGSGVMTDLDAQRVMQALDSNMATNKMLLADIQPLESNDMMQSRLPDLSVMQDEPMPMSDVDTSVFQPLVDLGFEQEVRTILTNPMNSVPSVEAQQKIIEELGTGIDIDGFRMEIQKFAPKDVDVTMSNIEAGGDTRKMMTPVSMKISDLDTKGILGMMGRNEDTTIGHLAEGDVVVPPEVLQANPPIADALDETMMEMGVDPRSRIVDTTGELGGIASINPQTGLQEFFIKKALSKLNRARKKITKKVAPIVLPMVLPGVGSAIGGALGSAGSAIVGGLSKIPVVGEALSSGASAIGNLASRAVSGIPSLLGRGANYDPATGSGQSAVGRIEDIFKAVTGDDGRTRREELEDAGYSKTDIDNLLKNPIALNTELSKIRRQQQTQVDSKGNIINQGGMSTGGQFALAGLAGLLGKLAYEEQKKQKGVPLTPLTTMDALGRYNIASEIARRTGEEMPSRVEFGLTAEGMPALSGGMPRNARNGGIMAFAQGGAVAMQEGGEPPINMADFPRKNGEIDGPGTGTSDDIPAMLSDGEFVMTAKAVRNAGSYDMSSNNGIVTLSPNGGSDREAGTRIMYKLMSHFENLA
jgi:hypothetical protein